MRFKTHYMSAVSLLRIILPVRCFNYDITTVLPISPYISVVLSTRCSLLPSIRTVYVANRKSRNIEHIAERPRCSFPVCFIMFVFHLHKLVIYKLYTLSFPAVLYLCLNITPTTICKVKRLPRCIFYYCLSFPNKLPK